VSDGRAAGRGAVASYCSRTLDRGCWTGSSGRWLRLLASAGLQEQSTVGCYHWAGRSLACDATATSSCHRHRRPPPPPGRQPRTRPAYPSIPPGQILCRKLHAHVLVFQSKFPISTRGVAKVNFVSITQNGRRMCAWLDELQRGHYVAGCRCIFLTETATNVVRVVARCATTDGGKWVGLVSDLALR
jgi:hypothetical protein